MTTLKIFLSVLFLSLFFIQPVNVKADGEVGNKATELNSQIIEEVKEILKTPYLKFESKDLNGEVNLVCQITNEGKIIFKDVKGLNEDLVDNVISRLNLLNLWTSPDYSRDEFVYRIKYKN